MAYAMVRSSSAAGSPVPAATAAPAGFTGAERVVAGLAGVGRAKRLAGSIAPAEDEL